MRRSWMFILAFILAAGVVLALFSTYPIRNMVSVQAPVNEVAFQFNKPANWKNWYPLYENIDSIEVQNPLSVKATQSRNGSITTSFITAQPMDNGRYTNVYLEEKQKGYRWFSQQFGSDTISIIQFLKSYMEDDHRRYGFPIDVIPVKDTLILTTKVIITSEEKMQTIDALRRQLQAFISAHKITRSGDYYFVSSITTADQKIEIAVGIPVKNTNGHQNNFQFLKLPANGRLISGKYTGPFGERNKLYAAIDKYIFDKKFRKVAQPLEKYNLSDTALANEKKIEMTLYYPIF